MKVEPNSDMRQGAMAMFEAYTAWKDAGFTEDQALQLVAIAMTQDMKGNE